MTAKERIRTKPDKNFWIPIIVSFLCAAIIVIILFYLKKEMSSKINLIGITFDFTGAILILVFSVPSMLLKGKKEGIMFEELTVTEQIVQNFRDNYNKDIRVNFSIGIVYLCLGFGFLILSYVI